MHSEVDLVVQWPGNIIPGVERGRRHAGRGDTLQSELFNLGMWGVRPPVITLVAKWSKACEMYLASELSFQS